jgi:excisionase family DNA binding protein
MPKISPTPLAVSPRDAGRMAGISRSRVYELIKAGELPAYKDGALTLILVSDIEARLARLKPFPKAARSTGPLLSREERALARQRAREAADRESQGAAQSPESEPELDLAAMHEERVWLLTGNVGPDEARLRSFEYVVGVCRHITKSSLEDAKRMVAAAIAAREARARLKEKV